ncbi:MAG: glutaredoxin [Tissierellales bacterium]
MKEFLSNESIEFIYLDITENMLNLKSFLKFRDNSPRFDEVKKAGRVGIPCIVINKGEIIAFEKEELNLEELRTK